MGRLKKGPEKRRRQERFITAWTKSFSVRGAARKIGITDLTVYKWMREDAGFKELFGLARMRIIDTLEERVMKLVIGGDIATTKSYKKKGEVVTKRQELKNVISLLSRIARNETTLAPEGWGEKKDIRVNMKVQYEESIKIVMIEVVGVIRRYVSDKRTLRRIGSELGRIRLTGSESDAIEVAAAGDRKSED